MGSEVQGIVKLKCSVKNYDWGKPGKESTVARLYGNTVGCEPYAELWMGTHESGPSYVMLNGGSDQEEGARKVSLREWIEQNPCVLGDRVLKKWRSNLPFLFKVLSVEKALSLQAHPDKDLASILHKQYPGVYKDDNHKPEMALALTEFEALCGFICLEELKDVVLTVPEIIEAVGNSLADQVLNLRKGDEDKKSKEVLQSLFTKLMFINKDKISQLIPSLINRLNSSRKARKLTEKEELVIKLESQYPGDIGVIASYLLNYIKLKPGEALFLDANEPHAYITGECIECMATSDNVVRAGLTPKYRDVETLCSMLTYKQGFPEILKGIPSNPYTMKYSPPFDEFEVDVCSLPNGRVSSSVFVAVCGPTIFIITRGKGRMSVSCSSSSRQEIGEGDVFFAPANLEITIETSIGLDLYRAGVNSSFLEIPNA